jgi:FkbM family methyltransferase
MYSLDMLSLILRKLRQRYNSSKIQEQPENAVGSKKLIQIQGSINYSIGQFDLSLPSDHKLPFYQDIAPYYDRYFGSWLKFLRVEDRPLVILDIGANVGDSAFYFLSCESNSKIYGVEADPIFYSYLLHNITKNKAEDFIIPLHYALLPPSLLKNQYRIVSNHGTSKLVSGEFEQEALGFEETEDLTKVRVDDLLKYSKFDFIKIDIDSFDALLALEFINKAESSESVLLVEIDSRSMENNTSNIVTLFSEAIALTYSFITVDNKGRVIGSSFSTISNFVDLLNWIKIQHKIQNIDVFYLDVWFFPASKVSIFKTLCELIDKE